MDMVDGLRNQGLELRWMDEILHPLGGYRV